MDHFSDKIKIKDIADKAGVSPGTVDRVLHNRGNVSEETRKKITAILEEINYTPNVYARALASKRTIVLSCIIPSYTEGEYWEMIGSGIQRVSEELADFRIKIQPFYYDQYNAKSFCKAMDEVLSKPSDGILLAPTLKSVTFEYTSRLQNAGIPFVFIDSNIEEAAALAYYGQHSYQSGRLAAKLLLSGNPDISEIAAFTFYHIEPANQINLRMSGFSSYISEKRSNCKLHSITLDAFNLKKNEAAMKGLFHQYPGIEGAVIFSSRPYVVAEFLEKYGLDQISLIGYDLLERNVDFLKKGTISYLIAQRPEEQVYKGIKALSDHLLFKKPINRINYTPIDILTQENIDFYLEF